MSSCLPDTNTFGELMFYLDSSSRLMPLPLRDVKDSPNTKNLRRVFFTWNNYPDLESFLSDPTLAKTANLLDPTAYPSSEVSSSSSLFSSDPDTPVSSSLKHQLWSDYFSSIPDLKGFTVGFEVGESGTPHLQGVLLFSQQKTFKTLRRWLYKAHLEDVRDLKKSLAYCRKDGDFIFGGDLPEFRDHDHKSESYGDFMEMVLSGASIRDLSQDFPFLTLRNIRNVRDIRHALMAEDSYGVFTKDGEFTEDS